MSPFQVLLLFLMLRITSVFVVSTWYVPDEYWQSLEVAHKLTFGYGYLTWEWSHGIRSYVYPTIISAVYKLLAITQLDSATLLIFLPRLLQSILSAYSDYCFWKWCGKTKWSIFCIATSWFWFYTASRTLANTVETSLTTIALSQFPFQKGTLKSNGHFLWLVATLFVVRPTAAIVWVPLCIYHIITSSDSIIKLFINYYLLPGLVISLLSCALDSFQHGAFVVTWWEFLKFNVFRGIGDWYGVQPWHWYLSQGFPAVMGIFLLPFLLASARILKYRKVYIEEFYLLATITFTIFTYSFLSHKEFRFLMPVLPIALYITSQYLSEWSRRANNWLVWFVASSILLANLIPAIYVGNFHQRGPLDVMVPLRDIASKTANASFLFLTPCHSTPLYSHIHANVTTRFLTCNPNFGNVASYLDEADHFYNSPSSWIRNNYPINKPLPTHIIAYDVLVPYITDLLSRYKRIHHLYNTYVVGDNRIGKFITIHELVNV